jgi:hypothetical protein
MDDGLRPSFLSSPWALLLMAASIGFYAGAGYGWLIGTGFAIAFLIAIAVGNGIILRKLGSLSWTTRFRVILYVVIMLLIALTRAEACSASGCSRLIG